MDKVKTDFEAWVYSNKWNINKFDDGTYVDSFVEGAFYGYKSRVPDTHVVVPKEPTEEFKDRLTNYLDDLWMGEWGCDWDGFICVNGIDPNHVWKIVTDTKAMIEAQEQ